jgi:hypothetical protein
MKAFVSALILAALVLPLAACETHSTTTTSRNPLTGSTTYQNTTVRENNLTGTTTVEESKVRAR